MLFPSSRSCKYTPDRHGTTITRLCDFIRGEPLNPSTLSFKQLAIYVFVTNLVKASSVTCYYYAERVLLMPSCYLTLYDVYIVAF
jgi:hypothetical protein